MTDVQNTQDTPNEAEQAIASLKKQADRLGISYKSNTSIASLQKAIKEKLEGPIGGEESPAEITEPVSTAKGVKAKGVSIEDAIAKAMKLHRVIITPMDANKASNLEREMFCAGNSTVGTVKRVVEFGEPWHVEEILLNTIKEKRYQAFVVRKNAQGVEITTSKLVPAYSIAYLEPLTQEEIDELALRQVRTRALEDE